MKFHLLNNYIQDTSQFKFPLELDMTPYGCGSHGNTTEGGGRGGEGGGGGGGGGGEGGGGGGGGGGERVEYELYSVVIHSGSTHSGHYTAYIRDIDNLGSWTHPVSDVMMTSFYSSGIHIIHTHPTGTFLTTRCKTNNLVCRS